MHQKLLKSVHFSPSYFLKINVSSLSLKNGVVVIDVDGWADFWRTLYNIVVYTCVSSSSEILRTDCLGHVHKSVGRPTIAPVQSRAARTPNFTQFCVAFDGIEPN